VSDLAIVGLTVAAASLSTVAIAVPGIAAGYALARYRGAWRGAIETVLSLPLVLPPTAVGLLLLQTLRPNGPLGAIGRHVVFTFRGVVIATAVMSFPLLVRSARTAFEEIDPLLVQVARTLGASPFAAFRRVALPLAVRGVAAGLLLAFSRALGEFGATILVAGNIEGETQTLALAIFSRTQAGNDAGALRLVWITVGLAFIAIWTTELLTRRRDR
jgi:molybdate transport system permease protein